MIENGNDQDIFIVSFAPTPRPEASVPEGHLHKGSLSGAQDLIIAAPNGLLYHVKQEVWQDEKRIVPPEAIPKNVETLTRLNSLLAYVPLTESTESAAPAAPVEPPPPPGYYLANFLPLNPPTTTPTTYLVPPSLWRKRMFRPGNSTKILDLLNWGTTMAYIPWSARATDCVCYVLNLASLNRSDIFEMSHGDCEVDPPYHD